MLCVDWGLVVCWGLLSVGGGGRQGGMGLSFRDTASRGSGCWGGWSCQHALGVRTNAPERQLTTEATSGIESGELYFGTLLFILFDEFYSCIDIVEYLALTSALVRSRQR